MNTQPIIDIRKIFSNPIILDHFINHCPNCCSFDIHCIENYERDGKKVSIFECNYCGACWEVEIDKPIGEKMKIKDGCKISTSDFWYDLTDGGYLKPEEILESEQDIKRVKDAIELIKDFQDSCESQIDGFIE